MEMDHIQVLKRAWETTWRYRALWIFGIILALTTASGGSSGSASGGGGNGGGNGNGFPPPGDLPWPREYHWPEIPAHVVSTLVIVSVGLVCGILLLVIVAAVARYVAETALIRMVDDHEETGVQHSVREGFRIGWSRTALRLFLINLLVSLPTTLVFILLFGLALAPLLLWTTGSRPAGVIGTIAAIGMFFLVLLLAIVVGAVIKLLRRFFWRASGLEDLGVLDSIREGFGVVRRHLKDVVIMWLIMIGVRIGWAIAMVVAFVVLLPVVILSILVGGVLGGVPALLVGGLTSLFLSGPVPWIVGALIGLPIFILVMAAPWVFLSGLMEVFKSSTWTLTYRELRALEGLETAVEEWPELDEPDLDSPSDSR
jgi:hypothetical protein